MEFWEIIIMWFFYKQNDEIYTEWNFESDYFDWLHEQKIMKYIQNGILRAFFDTLHIVRNPHEIYTEWNFELCRKLHSLCIMPWNIYRMEFWGRNVPKTFLHILMKYIQNGILRISNFSIRTWSNVMKYIQNGILSRHHLLEFFLQFHEIYTEWNFEEYRIRKGWSQFSMKYIQNGILSVQLLLKVAL